MVFADIAQPRWAVKLNSDWSDVTRAVRATSLHHHPVLGKLSESTYAWRVM